MDQDGWDEDRDGFVTGDPVTTETGVSLGEALSSYEEYLVHDDLGNVVRSGLKHVAFGAEDTWVEVPVRLASPSTNVAILHHDVRDLHVNDQDVYILTRHGITHWAVDEDTSNDMWWPHAIRLTDMVPLNVDGALAGFAVTSTGGLQIIPLLEDGALAPMETWSHMDAPALERAVVLDLDGASMHVLALGANGDGGVWTIGSDLQPNGDVMGALSAGVRSALSSTNATVTALAHAPGVDGVPTFSSEQIAASWSSKPLPHETRTSTAHGCSTSPSNPRWWTGTSTRCGPSVPTSVKPPPKSETWSWMARVLTSSTPFGWRCPWHPPS